MKETVSTKGLSAGSLFKIVFVGFGFSLGPLILLFGILSIFGFETVKLNNEPVTGIAGFVLSLVMVPFFVLVLSAMIWLFLAPGNWLYTRVRGITISYQGSGDDGGKIPDSGTAARDSWRVTSYEPASSTVSTRAGQEDTVSSSEGHDRAGDH